MSRGKNILKSSQMLVKQKPKQYQKLNSFKKFNKNQLEKKGWRVGGWEEGKKTTQELSPWGSFSQSALPRTYGILHF
jgi:hypothetical protein